ncbi:hypothetical protein QQ045_026423 [Rhodiola kirilowii]
MDSVAARSSMRSGGGVMMNTNRQRREQAAIGGYCFQMPLHYPCYTRAEYEAMPEWRLDSLLSEYGLPATGNLDKKREYAIGAFLWGRQ